MSVADRARASATAQGLPEHVEDPTTLARIATLIISGLRNSDGEGDRDD